MDEARHLDVVHREHHRGVRARLAERLAQLGDLLDAAAHAAELHGHERGEQPGLAQRGERLAREARLAIDGVGGGCGRALGDAADERDELRARGARRVGGEGGLHRGSERHEWA